MRHHIEMFILTDSESDLQDAAMPVAVAFTGVEIAFASALSVVAYKIGFGKAPYTFSFSTFVLFLSALLLLSSSIYAFVVGDDAVALVFVAQWLSDLSGWFLARRAASNGFLRGSASVWRAVVSCTITLLSIPFVTSLTEARGLLLTSLILRLMYIVIPIVEDKARDARARRHIEYLDEWGLLFNKWPSSSSRVFISYPGDDEDYDSENPVDSTIENSLGESLLISAGSINGSSAPGTRNNSASTSDSTESFPLIRPSSALRERVYIAPEIGQMITQSRRADDAAGRRPQESSVLIQRLPEHVRVIAHKEVLTTGGVPLVVYVLQTNRNEILVHRYGEFRALCNRVLSRFYQELGAEAPPFPGRRVFRKFIPQSMGGMAQGAAADREFITNRANGLGDWTQQVLEFVRDHPHEATMLALLDFLKPIVHYSPDSDLEQVIRSAVLIFSDTVLNPIAPPSPYL